MLNADDRLVAAMAGRTQARVLTFGRSAEADVRALEVAIPDGRPTFVLSTPAGTADQRYPFIVNVGNNLGGSVR